MVALVAPVSCAAPPATAVPVRTEPTRAPRATVLLFISTDCPICNGYQPEIERLRARFAPSGIDFAGIYAEVPVEQGEVDRHVRDFGIRYPVRIDSDLALRRRFHVTVVPEVVVVAGAAAEGAPVLYQGRIDDQWPERGSRRPSAQVHDLEDALDAIARGQPPRTARTRAVGCVLGD
jgi:hypothetical protein